MPFPSDLTSVLTGATIRQLSYWRTSGFFVPEVRTGRPFVLYSFRDVVALRTVVRLRDEQSLQKIRRAFATLQDMDLTEHPSAYTIVAAGSSILLRHDDGSGVDLLESSKHTLVMTLGDVFDGFITDDGSHVAPMLHPRESLEIRERRLGGWPVIRGTRVPYDDVSDLVSDGSISPEQVSRFYPSGSADATLDALSLARDVASVREAA